MLRKRIPKQRSRPKTLRHKGPIKLVDLHRVSKTNEVLVKPAVIALFLEHSARHPRNEVGALLLGRMVGRFLVVEDLVKAENVGTAVNIEFTPRDFDRAGAALKEGQCVLGWAHSHPTYGAFLSPTDVRFQAQGQGLFPDYVALVMDPFHGRGVDYAFFRVHSDQAVQIPHNYLGGEDEARTASPDS